MGSTTNTVRSFDVGRYEEGSLANRSGGSLNTEKITVLAGVSYLVATIIGFTFIPTQHGIFILWPPDAVLLAFLLLIPRRLWWVIMVAAVLPTHLFIQLHYKIPFTTAMEWFISNTGEALLGAYLISRMCDVAELFTEIRAFKRFLLVGVLGVPVIASLIDAGLVSTTELDHGHWLTWTTRLFPNMLAQLIIIPMIVTWCLEGKSWIGEVNLKRCVEGAALLTCLVSLTIGAIPFGISYTSEFQLVFLALPVLLWAALRFGVGGVSTCLLIISVIVCWAATNRQGSFPLSSLADVIHVQVYLCLLSLPVLFLGVLLAQHSRTQASLRESKACLIDSQEQERRRIARELHDGIGQSLALLQLELAGLETECSPETKTRIQSIGKQVIDVSGVAREISHGLHPSHLEYVGLRGALKELCRIFGRDMSLNIDFSQSMIPDPLAPEVSLSVYRVTQEALHNVSKYSHARNVGVRLQLVGNALVLEVQDDGIGFAINHQRSCGIGISNMQERIESVGGRMSIKSAQLQGTKITASVPLKRVLRRCA